MFHPTMGTDETIEVEISTTKDTKPHESRQRVSLDTIRAERSEQEVAVAAFNLEAGLPY